MPTNPAPGVAETDHMGFADYQAANPAYAGEYLPHFLDNPGILPGYNDLAPAPGSENLTAPRTTGGVPGTNRLFIPDGPVDGSAASPGWTGKRTPLRPLTVGNNGPVSGGADTGAVAANAYFASVAARVSKAASDAAIVSAV